MTRKPGSPPSTAPTDPASAAASTRHLMATTPSANHPGAGGSTLRPAEGRSPRRLRTGAALVVALAAAATLVLTGGAGQDDPKSPPARVSATAAWPGAQRADLPAGLADGPLLTPLLFLDTTTVVGTAPAPNGAEQRLLLRSAGGLRELRRVSLDGNPQFSAVTAADGRIFWAESTDGAPRIRLWTADLSGGAARQLTADTGNAVFFGTEHDLVVADGRVHWAAAPGDARTSTEIRSVPLGGGPVRTRTEPGEWALSAWPWLVDEGGARLRNMTTNRDTEVSSTGPATVSCTPTWCRAIALGDGTAGIDMFHPDGSARRRIAGPSAQSAVADVAVLDRFEILAEPRPDSDVTGTSALVVYDLSTGRTVDVAPEASGAFTRNGLLWWSTGDDDIVYHVIDLRTA